MDMAKVKAAVNSPVGAVACGYFIGRFAYDHLAPVCRFLRNKLAAPKKA